MSEPIMEVNREYVELALKAAQQFGDKQQEMVLVSWLEVHYDCKVLTEQVKRLKRLMGRLSDAYEAGFSEGFHCEDNPGEPQGFHEWTRKIEGEALRG